MEVLGCVIWFIFVINLLGLVCALGIWRDKNTGYRFKVLEKKFKGGRHCRWRIQLGKRRFCFYTKKDCDGYESSCHHLIKSKEKETHENNW